MFMFTPAPEFFSPALPKLRPDSACVVHVMSWWKRVSDSITPADSIIMPPVKRLPHDACGGNSIFDFAEP
jgi:hypothetical protein